MEEIVKIAVNNGIGLACAVFVLWRDWYRETTTLPKILDTFATLTREERAVYQKWHEENRVRLDRVGDDLKELRHYNRNLAHQLGLQQQVEREMRQEKPNVQPTTS